MADKDRRKWTLNQRKAADEALIKELEDEFRTVSSTSRAISLVRQALNPWSRQFSQPLKVVAAALENFFGGHTSKKFSEEDRNSRLKSLREAIETKWTQDTSSQEWYDRWIRSEESIFKRLTMMKMQLTPAKAAPVIGDGLVTMPETTRDAENLASEDTIHSEESESSEENVWEDESPLMMGNSMSLPQSQSSFPINSISINESILYRVS